MRIRRRFVTLTAAASIAVAAPAGAQEAASPPLAPAALAAHVEVLASDAMGGRLPDTPGFAAAADYVAARLHAAGLRPGGTDGFREAVPLVRVRPAGPARVTWRPSHGASRAMAAGSEYFADADPARPHAAARARVVFVGYGVSQPRLGHDDYAGIDVRGRIVAVAAGGPARLAGEERGVIWNLDAKRAAAAAHGAVGMVQVQIDPRTDAVPFATSAAVAARPSLAWAPPAGTAVPLLATLSATGARLVFGPRWQANVRQGWRDDPRYVRLVSRGTLDAAVATAVEPVPSGNVVGVLPGSDPALAHEIVVVSAHLDHLGERPAGPGDRIYNGALDNAIGVAGTIEIARRLAAAPPRRTTLFLVTTGEEAGLLGSDWFVHDPAMPVGRIVADVNLDMPILTYPFADVIGYGGAHSTLGATLTAVLARAGLRSSPDPEPGQSLFIRSDQFSFARAGIPAIMPWPGREGPGAAATEDFLSHRYHQPSDDTRHPIDWRQASRFFAIVADAVVAVADAPARPAWLPGDRLGIAATALAQ